MVTFILDFLQTIHPRIKNPYVLITQGGILSLPGKYAHILEDQKIIAWFTKNFDGYKHDKLFALPLCLQCPSLG